MSTTRWELRQGDTLLGILTAYSWDFPWVDCDFAPTQAGRDHGALFSEELQSLLDVRHDEDWQTWEAAYHTIEAQGVVFVPADDAARDLLADLVERAGDNVWFDAIFRER
jgi:hypothetical protein